MLVFPVGNRCGRGIPACAPVGVTPSVTQSPCRKCPAEKKVKQADSIGPLRTLGQKKATLGSQYKPVDKCIFVCACVQGGMERERASESECVCARAREKASGGEMETCLFKTLLQMEPEHVSQKTRFPCDFQARPLVCSILSGSFHPPR